MTDLLQHQIDYYSARAPEYDQWFYRQGRYDRGAAFKRQWESEAGIVREQLLNAPRQAHILEMAPGTGIWTEQLIRIGDRVTALDASPEMIAINKAKLASDKVSYIQTDLFAWRAREQYDMVFFGFWLSHVPGEKLSSFLGAVYDALKPGGRLFFVDSQERDMSNRRAETEDLGGEMQQRVLSDGRRYEIVKIYYDPAQLTKILRDGGFEIEVRTTPNFFIYADGLKPI
ncbi:MAG: methyltransferase domain-containing protein [Chloroflexota bacterium]|nr:methyltransferase domain-containing protein [Chloroflexota bacterium]